MKVKLKYLKGDKTWYYLKKETLTLLCHGDFISKILTHPNVSLLWGIESEEDFVDVEKAKLGVEVDSVWIDELEEE